MRLGAMFAADQPVDGLAAFAERVESLGYDELWLAEDCFLHGGIATAAFVLGRTERVAVGIGLLPVGLRLPSLAAMELGTLAELYPDRVRIAFGHGVESWMRQIGARPRNRIAALEQTAGIVDRLLRGETVSHDGAIQLDGVALDRPPARPPELLIGSTGPRALRVAAGLGMGYLLPEGAGPEAVRWARAGLGSDRSVTVYSWLSIAEDGAAAEAALLPLIRRWREMDLYPQLYERAGLPAADAITAEHLSRLAIVGSPERCAAQIRALEQAGADAVILLPAGADPLAELERVRHEVVGRL